MPISMSSRVMENKRIEHLGRVFRDFDFVIATLRVIDEAELRRRVMDESRSSGYRDWKESVRINRQLFLRPPFPNERFIDVCTESVEEAADKVLELTRRHNGP